MTNIIISKDSFLKFFNRSLSEFQENYFITQEQEEKEEEFGLESEISEETYLLGIDINGEFIYTESASYIEFSKTVFFINFDLEYMEQLANLDEDNMPFTSQSDFDYIKEMIELRFKNIHNEIVDVTFID